MKITARTVVLAMIVSILTSVDGVALTTNYFITANGELQNPANWSDGNLPRATNGYVGVLDNINAGSATTPGGAYLGLNLILQGTSQTTGNPDAGQTIDKTIVVKDSAKLYTPSAFTMSGTVTIMNTATQQCGKNMAINSGGLVDVYNSGSLQGSRLVTISSNAIVRLNDSATMIVGSSIYFLAINAGGYLDFTSTNAVFRQRDFDTTATLTQMISDGRIRINGKQADVSEFSVGFVSGTGTTLRVSRLLSAPKVHLLLVR